MKIIAGAMWAGACLGLLCEGGIGIGIVLLANAALLIYGIDKGNEQAREARGA